MILCFQVLAGLYTPADGYIDPYSLTMAIAAGARLHGAYIYQNTEVSKMEMRPDGSWDVVTPKGTIHTNRVVNCTGISQDMTSFRNDKSNLSTTYSLISTLLYFFDHRFLG